MKATHSPEEAFQALLDGEQAEASSELTLMKKLATALQPVSLPGPSAQFRARTRSMLLAKASVSEEELFAEALQDPTVAEPAMASLVAMAAALAPANLPEPAPAFRYQLRNKLITEATSGSRSLGTRAAERFAAVNARMRRSLKVVTATGAAAALLAGSGATLVFARTALPVDPLYGVKRLHESAQLWATDGVAKGFTLLEFARIRLEEVRGMAYRPVSDPVPYVSTLKDMNGETIGGTSIVIADFNVTGLRENLERVGAFARVQLSDLAGLRGRLPAGAMPTVDDSLTIAAQVIRRIENVLAGCSPCSQVSPLAPAPGEQPVSCSCTQPSNGGGSTQAADRGNGSGSTAGDDGGQFKPRPPPPSPPPRQRIIPDVPGDTDDQVDALLNDILNNLPIATEAPPTGIVPSALPTLPSLPPISVP